MTAFTVRRASPSDAQDMADILNPLIEQGTSTAIQGPQTAADWQALAAGEIDRSACFVAVGDDGVVLGFQYVEPSAIEPSMTCSIATFARIDRGGHGIGRALFAQVVRAARALGFHTIEARIRADNVSGLGYYTAMEFNDESTAKAVPLADGRCVDRIRKTFDLRPIDER